MMAVNVMTMPDFTLGKLSVVLNRIITILQKHEDLLVRFSLKAASGADCFEELFDREILARFHELRLHAFVRMHVYFDLFHNNFSFIACILPACFHYSAHCSLWQAVILQIK